MAARTPLQEHARRAASALAIALFGSLALLHCLWSAWCLGWLSTSAAAYLLVIGSLTLLAGYGTQLARFHRTLNPPPFTGGEKLLYAAYWCAAALLTLKVLWPRGGFLGPLSGPLAILEALLLFLLLREFRQDGKGLALSLATWLLHLLGWGLLGWLFLHLLDLFCAPLLQGTAFRLLAGFPAGLDQGLTDLLTATGPLLPLLGVLAVAASWWLRLLLFRRCLPEPVPLLHRGAWCALALFLLSLIFSTGSYALLRSRWKAARPPRDTPSREESLQAGSLALRQKDLGAMLEQVVLLQDGREDTPLLWDTFLQEAERLERLLLPGQGIQNLSWDAFLQEAPGEDPEELLRQMEPALHALDALEEVLEDHPQGILTPGVFRLEQWRFLNALKRQNIPDALRSLENNQALILHELTSDSFFRRLQAAGQTRLWAPMVRLLPQEPRAIALTRTLRDAWENTPEETPLQEARRRPQRQLEALLLAPGGLDAPSLLLPFPAMLAMADSLALDKTFHAPHDHQEVALPRGFGGFYTLTSCFFLGKTYHQARLQALIDLDALLSP
ncbi:MAG: hypothetical protein ACI4SG_08535 [Oligosphaeraceae bacterium]